MSAGLAELAGRVALVTGGSGGLGGAISARLASVGASVAVGYNASADKAAATVEAIGAAGGRAVPFRADASDPDGPARLCDEVEAELGPIDILVPNAGVSRRRDLGEVSLEDWDLLMAVNLRDPFLLARRVAPGMRERGWGRILFMSSIAGLRGSLLGPHYAASKAGLIGLTHDLATRLAPDGITVNALAPALVGDTGMVQSNPELTRQLPPVGRLGRSEEVADLALATMSNGFLTNQVIGIDGGLFAH